MKLNKLAVACAITAALAAGSAQAAPIAWTGSFTMFDPTGAQMDANDAKPGMTAAVTGEIDLDAGTFTLASMDSFFGLNWTTSGGTLLFPGGPYSHDTTDPAPGVSGGTYTGINVGPNQLAGVIDFAWGGTSGIDVVMVWDVTEDASGKHFFSTDWDGDGIRGAGMIDGPFPGFSANFDMTPIPAPAAVWLFGAGIAGLMGMVRRSRNQPIAI